MILLILHKLERIGLTLKSKIQAGTYHRNEDNIPKIKKQIATTYMIAASGMCMSKWYRNHNIMLSTLASLKLRMH
jgi:hypothetical protein